ncbi:spaetzle-processing enzyme-like isoform X2 [Drosophila ficusphila]|uniref:spaetzle-processing enzyme-like isoform X2 n=1 Tax=Drosophila ficusphila TaxID=30025 RepID=UPI0007E6F73F|nr:spaetzle-processing enzyme-like isoform X2 [Drosophila ficusphila]
MEVFKAGTALLAFLFIWIKGGSSFVLEQNCGTRTPSEFAPKIKNGADTSVFANPWMVKINSERPCGGSLLTSRYVLTAAHCIFNSNMSVSLGEYEIQNPGKHCFLNGKCVPTAYKLNVDKKFVHRDFYNSKNDIALLRLESEVEFSDFVKPICLIVKNNFSFMPLSFNITGWGITKEEKLSRILQIATVGYLHKSLCNQKWEEMRLDGSQLCAGDLKQGNDSCAGDSGGPLSSSITLADGSVRAFQFGIINWIVDVIRKN